LLSILIPTYNYDCYLLVASLISQIKNNELVYEIICIDDASTLKFKNPPKELLSESNFISHIKLKKNIGRSRIRNLLVFKAKYNWILFLDADTLPTHTNFIDNYITIIKQNPPEHVFSGGLAYRIEDTTRLSTLRYRYGTVRESISPEKRSRNPYTSLLMSNTLIKKDVFDKVSFNEKITLYGHEDAVFSFDLYGAGFAVKHIDNTVFHTGLESNKIFLSKSKIAVKNLWYLYLQSMIHPEMNRLLKSYVKAKTWGISSILSFTYIRFHNYFEKKLQLENPSLRLFDIYRLSYLCYIANSEN